MAAMDLRQLTATFVLKTQLRMNTEIATVIGSGRVLAAMSSYIRANVTQSALDVLVHPHQTVSNVTNMHSWITMTHVNAKRTGTVLTVDLIHSQDIAMFSVMVTVSVPVPLIVSNAYPILIVMKTKLVFATLDGLETTVAYITTMRRVTLGVIIVMVV